MAPGKRFWKEVTVSYVCTQNAYNIPHQDPACAFAAHVDILYQLLRKVKIITFYNLTLNRIHIYIFHILLFLWLLHHRLQYAMDYN